MEQLPSTTSTLEESRSPEKLEQALAGHGNSASIARQSCQFQLAWGSAPLFPRGPARCSCPQQVLHSHGEASQHHQHPGRVPYTKKLEQLLAGHGKSASIAGHSCQFWLPWGSAPLFLSSQASCSHSWEVLYTNRAMPSTTSPMEEPHGPETSEPALPSCTKSASITVQTSQSCLPSGSPPCFRETLLAPPNLRKSHAASKRTDQ